MRKRVTLKQLAAELNLSISTVSKSLKNDPEISQETIERVKKLAKEKNYRPNALAVSLKSSKTMSIGVIVPDILNNFFAKVLLGIEKEATKNNYKIVTCISSESYQKELDYLDMLSYNGVDGFILAASQESQTKDLFEHFNDILKDDIPIVMFDRVVEDVYCDKVIVNDKQSSEDAIDKLVASGCKKIGIVSNIQKLSVGLERLEGAEKALAKYGMTTEILKLKKKDEFEDQISKFIEEYNFDAILGLDETSAVSAINAAQILDKKIPNDIQIIGFTDGILSKHSYPKLTTISQNASKMGEEAARILIDKLELRAERYLPETKVIKTKIIERGTTK